MTETAETATGAEAGATGQEAATGHAAAADPSPAASPMDPAAAGPPSLAVEAAEREPLLEEIAAVAGAVHEPRARALYAELAAAVAGGDVAPALMAALQRVLEMSLATGRARRFHGAQHEAALLRLFFRTPAGEALRRSAEASSRALAALAGQRIAALAVSAQAPGLFRLQLDTDRCQVTLEVNRDGVEVTGLGVEI